MRKFISQIATAAAVAAFASVSAQAMPMPVVDEITAAPSIVQEVDWHRGHGGWHGGRGYYGGGGCYYGGCYHHHHNNYWVPLAAFGAGALVGALAVQPHYHSYYRQSGHYAWCEGQYGPYRCYVPNY